MVPRAIAYPILVLIAAVLLERRLGRQQKRAVPPVETGKKCGGRISPAIVFCPNCGSALATVGEPPRSFDGTGTDKKS